MKHNALITILVLGLSACAVTPQHDISGLNLSQDKALVRAYHESGAYTAETSRVAREARDYLDKRLAKGVTKPAIVFDVDETLISNYPYIDKDVDFGYIPKLQKAWEGRGEAPPIEPVRDLCRYAAGKGVAVFIITARPEQQRASTRMNLKRAGCENYTRLYLKTDLKEESAKYKTSRRREISESGYTILVNIGDQESDLRGGYSERTFKLPNHFYLIP
jgi:5'-nucleotidase (lipoprotein e(P4) family)